METFDWPAEPAITLKIREMNMSLTSSLFKRMGILLICLFTFSAIAVTPADFAKDIEYGEVKISPDGKHIGLVLIHDGKRQLAIVDSKNFQPVGGANFGENQEVGSFYWANNERLVIKIHEHEPWQRQPAYYGELFAVDINGKKGKIIYGYSAGDKQVGSNIKKQKSVEGWARIISLLPEDEDHILISSEPWSNDGSRVPTAHKLNINNGRLSGIIASGPVTAARFFADRDGEIKLAVGTTREDKTEVYKHTDDKEWVKLDVSEFGQDFAPLAMDESNEYLYLLDDANKDKNSLFKLNLETGERELLFGHDKVDIRAAIYGSDIESSYAVLLEADYPTYHVFNTDTEEAALFNQLTQTFKGYRISIRGSDAEGNLWIIKASNDTTAGTYYFFDKKTGQFTVPFANNTHIAANTLSQSIPVSFKARDDMDIHAFITYPAGVPETQNVPLVTLVHGGPHGPRDYWSYDSEVQMLAAQGYAVLRVNYRGSGGYGAKYEISGYREWGGKIQQDIIDGTKWIISQGGIDQSKVCIMGASFGGYSAMQSAILAPDLFKCAVATAGVYDLPQFMDVGNIPDRLLWGPSYLKRVLGEDEEKLKAFSPIYNLEKLKAPVLISHGKKDEQTPYDQAVDLKEKLEKMGKSFVWNPVDAETHGFYAEENQIAYFEKVAGFLAEHLK